MLAGMAFANAPVAAVHALAYPIGTHFHVPHGLSNSLVLPHVMSFNAEHQAGRDLYADIARILVPGAPPSGATNESLSERLVEYFHQLPHTLGLETRLRQVRQSP